MTEDQPRRSEPPLPHRLYKFRSLSSATDKRFARSMIVDGELYFANPMSFNDPFDTLPAISMESTRAERDQYFSRVVGERMEGKPRPERRRIELTMRRMGEREQLDAFRQAAIMTMGEIGVCSLTERNDHVLMWSHYADNHRGICVGIRHNASHFEGQWPLDVRYSRVRPVHNPIQRGSPSEMINMMLTKADFWAYEREWRLLHTSATGGAGARRYGAQCIASVHLGCRITPETRAEVLSWCAERSAPIEVYQAEPNLKTFDLQFKRV